MADLKLVTLFSVVGIVLSVALMIGQGRLPSTSDVAGFEEASMAVFARVASAVGR